MKHQGLPSVSGTLGSPQSKAQVARSVMASGPGALKLVSVTTPPTLGGLGLLVWSRKGSQPPPWEATLMCPWWLLGWQVLDPARHWWGQEGLGEGPLHFPQLD